MRKIYLTILSILFTINLFSQDTLTIMSYNVENLFDTRDDSLYNDSEYLRGGLRGWTYERYRQKLYNIAKVVAAAGEWNPPFLIGLCEIENYNVLYELTNKTGLQNIGYKIIHYESPDARGVDVGLLYLPNKFKPVSSRPIRVQLPNKQSTTRDILYASGTLTNGDTLHVFVNHFPSRLGGELESEPRRLAVARYLREAVDSLFVINDKAKVLILGDFNDMPDNNSIVKVLGANPFSADTTQVVDRKLYNITYKFHKEGRGTYRFQQQWNMLDQIIVSAALLQGGGKTEVLEKSTQIFSPEWLLEDDKPVGKKPFRTYIGMRYNGGFSDHLPVLVDIVLYK